MDGTRFDRWTRLLATGASRRGMMRGLGAAAVAVALGGRGAEAAATCIKNGKECDPKKRGQCCSGTCRKRKKARGHQCAPTPGALGCTVNDDSCALVFRRCPGNPDGSCIVLDNGKPFCSLGAAACATCETGADCDVAFGLKDGKCITRCPGCAANGGSACVFPEQIL
jgi:hypothetical protein